MDKVVIPIEAFPGIIRLPTRSALWLPQASLSACVRAVISRDTRGVALAPEQRYNHFPATPMCSLLWYLHGDAELLAPGDPACSESPGTPLPPASFCGPFSRPGVSRNAGPMHAFMVLLLPDALSALTGVDPGAFLNQVVPLDSPFDPVLHADWRAMFRQVAAAPDDEARAQLIKDFLHPRWQAARPDADSLVRDYRDWYQRLSLRAATSGLGRSLRQMERRIKQWTGQPLRELRGLSRSEQAFFDAVVASESGEVNWSEIASNTGYTDQSHLSRQTRRITGFPPEELRQRIFADESFWVYRLWGFAENRA